MFITLRNQALKIFLLLICLCFLASYLAVPVDLTTDDIGRHIRNGELVLAGQTGVLYKNFYSFTWGDYPFINHHWFFGVISCLIFHAIGFNGLEIFYILLLMLAFLLAFDVARRYAGFSLAFMASAVVFPLLISRAEIRPEGFSVFFMALYWWLLQGLLQGRFKAALLLGLIPLIQIVWVNTHIFFFMGPLLVAVFWRYAYRNGASQAICRTLQQLLWLSLAVNLINPSGLWGMLTPLNGFKKFGYALAENQTAWFMVHRFPEIFAYKYYFVTALIMVVGAMLALRRAGVKALPMVMLAVFAAGLAFRAVRLFMPYGFLFIPLAGYFYAPYIKEKIKVVGVLAGLAGMLLCVHLLRPQPFIGLVPGVNASAEFFKNSGLKGPVFSNYDIGGYLIYHLWPQEKVFVDNRQEAFPVDFFQKDYIPMQEDPSVWQKESLKYGFNVIYFARHDLTPWGQDFLVARIQDARWAPVFVDNYVIIFARRGSIDQGVIDRFELPKSMFKITKQ